MIIKRFQVKIGKFFLASLVVWAMAGVPEAHAQDSGLPEIFPKWMNDPNSCWLVLTFMVMAIAIAVLYRTNTMLVRMLSPQPKKVQLPVPVAGTVEKSPTLFSRIMHKLTASVPVSKEKDVLLDHNYDGIRELDNSLPPWWLYGFYITIAFAFLYMLHYHVSGTGKLQLDEYKEELVLAEQERLERQKLNAENITEDNVIALTDREGLNSGKDIYIKNCSPCHLANGGGQVGPNLTDEYWIHGGGIKNIFKTVLYGVPNKGMISWKAQLSPKQIQQVSSYVMSLHGSNPVGAKEPQGEKWVEQISADTLSVGTVN